jgi:hypothetical protein
MNIELLALEAALRTFQKEAAGGAMGARFKDMLAALRGIGTTTGIGLTAGLATGNPFIGLGASALAAPFFGRRSGEAQINAYGT